MTTNAKRRLLLYLVPALRELQVRLYSNDRVPTPSDTPANYTEAHFPGYGPGGLSSFGLPFLTGDVPPRARTVTPIFSFICTADPGIPVPIYGYMVWDFFGNLYWAERDPDAPTVIARRGERYDLALTLDLTAIT